MRRATALTVALPSGSATDRRGPPSETRRAAAAAGDGSTAAASVGPPGPTPAAAAADRSLQPAHPANASLLHPGRDSSSQKASPAALSLVSARAAANAGGGDAPRAPSLPAGRRWLRSLTTSAPSATSTARFGQS